MKLKRNIIASALTFGMIAGSAFAQTTAPVQPNVFTRVYSFGDSYSDVGAFGTPGNWYSNAATGQGEFPALISAHYGSVQTSAYTNLLSLTQLPNATGTNFAVGGARVADGATAKGSGTQITDLITRSGGKLDSKALYTIFIGGNDVSPNITVGLTPAAQGGGSTVAVNNMVAAALGVVAQVAQLRAAGAQNIILLDLGSLANVPTTIQSAAGTKAQYDAGAATATAGAAQLTLGATTATQAATAATAAAAAATLANDPATAATQTAIATAATANAATLTAQAATATAQAATLTATGKSASAGIITLAGLLPQAYSQTLAAALPKGSAMLFNFAQMSDYINLHPATFGFTNITTPICNPTIAVSTNWTACHGVAGAGALYADPLHITAAAHAAIANWITSSLDSIYTGAGLSTTSAQVPLGRSGAEWRTVDSRTRSYQNVGYKGDRMFVAGDYANARANDASGNKSADGDTRTFTLGYEATWGDNMLVGGTLGREKADFDLINNAGKLKYEETMLTLYATRKLDANWYVNGLISQGVLSFDSFRNASLGITTVTELASFGGRHTGAKAQLGYQMRTSDFVHGPFVGVDWEAARIKAFSEGSSSTAISVGAQTAQQGHYRVGYELAGGSASTFRPYAQLSYDYQFMKNERTFFSGMAATGSSIAIATRNDTGGFGRAAVGGSTSVGKSSELSVGVSSTFSNPAGRDTALNVVWSSAL